MMDKEGGPAFPCEQHECQDNTWNQTFNPGMSLRDWFAGMALQGLLARDIPEDNQTRPEYEMDKPEDLKRLSRASYECADAMLKAGANQQEYESH